MAKTGNQFKFTFYPTPKNPISITANPNSKLNDTINGAGEKLKNFLFNNHILFAEVNDQPGLVAVMPDFPCKELKPNGKVRAKPKKGATPTKSASDDCDKKNGATAKNRELFYIDSSCRGITKITSPSYDGKLLCVVAQAEDTLKEAIMKDGRFCEEFILLQDNDLQSDVPLHYKVSTYSQEVFIMKKRPPKRKTTDKLGTDHDEEYSETVGINPSKKSVYSTMPATVTEHFTDEIRKSMIEDARKSALETLVGSSVGKDKLDKKIQSIARKFGRVASYAIPARVMPKLTEATKSVGFIKCGDCTGSCTLLAKKVIITSQHVINDILTKRSQSTDKELYKTISIYFDFIRPHKLGTRYARVDETMIFTGQGKLDYAICFLKGVNSALTDLTPLGPFVRSVLPHSGLVILVGHPESEDKRVEICRILPGYNWHSTLCKRASDAEEYCKQHPEECNVNNMNESCVHIHKGRVLQGDHPDQLPYDTSFFHGSSGSPVFNSDGHIVAMHTQGYPFYQGSKKVSLMEFGVTFGAICRDVKERYGERTSNGLFPDECKDSSLEITMV